MILKKYESSYCLPMAQLFYDTVHSVNAADYTPQQLQAWAPGTVDLQAWDQSFSQHYTLLAIEGGQVLGFGDITPTGYLDRLYVHKDHQHQGIATFLCDRLEQAVAAERLTVAASITARPFFEKRGYRVLQEQQVERHGIILTNYRMEKIRSDKSRAALP